MHKIWGVLVGLATLGALGESVTLTWNQPFEVQVASWDVQWRPSTEPGQGPQTLIVSNTTTRPFIIPFLFAGTNYSLGVSAVGTNGLRSDVVEIRYTVPMPMPLPDGTPSPTNVRVVSLTPDAEFMRLRLSWNSGASNFVVSWTNASEPTGLALNTPFPSASVSGLVPGERYNLGVAAYSGTGEASESVSVKLTPAAISGPGVVLYRAQVGVLTPPIMPPLPVSGLARARAVAPVHPMANVIRSSPQDAFLAFSRGGIVAPLKLERGQFIVLEGTNAYIRNK